MPKSTRLTKSPEPANWLEHQLANALAGRPFSPRGEREAVRQREERLLAQLDALEL